MDDDGPIAGSILLIVTGPNDPPMFDMLVFSYTIPENPENDLVVGSLSFTDEGMKYRKC